MTLNEIKIKCLKGKEILPYILDLAKLRIDIFKDYPYLYVGDMDYETKYLKAFVECPESILVVVFDNEKVVGTSSAIPLKFETLEFQQPFLDKGIDINTIFYFGESLLRPEYRGKNIYRQFFRFREKAAKKYGSKITAFMSMERPHNDPRKPKDYVALDEVWKRFGYTRHPELCMYYEWKEIGEDSPSKKPLIFWLKNLAEAV